MYRKNNKSRTAYIVHRTSYIVLHISYFVRVGLAVCLLISGPAAFAPAATIEKPAQGLNLKEPVVVNGDNVEYYNDKKMVVGTGNISIDYKDVKLTCDKITVYLDTKEGIAEGNVKITQQGAAFAGDKINYNFETRNGIVIDATIMATPFYGKAKEIDKTGEKTATLDRGYVTTCDRQKPHYRIQARRVKIYLDDKIVATHVTLYIGSVPVMYLPYYVQPLKEYTAHATLLLGNERNWGYYGLSSFRYDFSSLAKGRARIDYRSKKGMAEGVDNYYDTKSVGAGSVRAYYINENDSTVYQKSDSENESKYLVRVRHSWDITDDTRMMLEFNKVRDQNVIKDYFYKEFEEQGDPDNYVSVITTKEDYTATFLVRKQVDKYFNVIERLPEYKIEIPNYRLLRDLPVYYKAEASGAYLNKKSASAVPSVKDMSSIRADAYNQLSYMARVFNFLSLTPHAGVRQTYYSRNVWGDTNIARGIFDAGLDASTKFYRVYDVTSDAFGLDINRLRHIITPTAGYYYTYQPTVSPNNLVQFDEIDAIDTANGVRLALENKLQTKRRQGETLINVDLATLIVSSDYMFRLKEDNLSYKSQKFKTVDFQLEFFPYPWLYSMSNLSVSTKKPGVGSASTDLTIVRGENYLGFGYRYEDVDGQKSGLATAEAMYRINSKWRARTYQRFNLEKGSPEEQEYTIYRDLHCWIAEFTYDIKSATKDQSFWIVMRLKAFPNIPLGMRNTYSRARPGSATNGPQIPPMTY